MAKIAVIDYGLGNLHSVVGALKHIGLTAFVSRDKGELSLADALILPGVGAFPVAMETLSRLGLDSFIKSEAQKKPLLGICLGMQLLFDISYEFKASAGLGLIGGEVVKLTAYSGDPRYKIPHMGWNSLEITGASPLTEGLPERPYVYFVHSFKAVVKNRADMLAAADYGEDIAAIVGRGNVWGTQFHPEKSEETGLTILRNFGRMI